MGRLWQWEDSSTKYKISPWKWEHYGIKCKNSPMKWELNFDSRLIPLHTLNVEKTCTWILLFEGNIFTTYNFHLARILSIICTQNSSEMVIRLCTLDFHLTPEIWIHNKN